MITPTNTMKSIYTQLRPMVKTLALFGACIISVSASDHVFGDTCGKDDAAVKLVLDIFGENKKIKSDGWNKLLDVCKISKVKAYRELFGKRIGTISKSELKPRKMGWREGKLAAFLNDLFALPRGETLIKEETIHEEGGEVYKKTLQNHLETLNTVASEICDQAAKEAKDELELLKLKLRMVQAVTPPAPIGDLSIPLKVSGAEYEDLNGLYIQKSDSRFQHQDNECSIEFGEKGKWIFYAENGDESIECYETLELPDDYDKKFSDLPPTGPRKWTDSRTSDTRPLKVEVQSKQWSYILCHDSQLFDVLKKSSSVEPALRGNVFADVQNRFPSPKTVVKNDLIEMLQEMQLHHELIQHANISEKDKEDAKKSTLFLGINCHGSEEAFQVNGDFIKSDENWMDKTLLQKIIRGTKDGDSGIPYTPKGSNGGQCRFEKGAPKESKVVAFFWACHAGNVFKLPTVLKPSGDGEWKTSDGQVVPRVRPVRKADVGSKVEARRDGEWERASLLMYSDDDVDLTVQYDEDDDMEVIPSGIDFVRRSSEEANILSFSSSTGVVTVSTLGKEVFAACMNNNGDPLSQDFTTMIEMMSENQKAMFARNGVIHKKAHDDHELDEDSAAQLVEKINQELTNFPAFKTDHEIAAGKVALREQLVNLRLAIAQKCFNKVKPAIFTNWSEDTTFMFGDNFASAMRGNREQTQHDTVYDFDAAKATLLRQGSTMDRARQIMATWRQSNARVNIAKLAAVARFAGKLTETTKQEFCIGKTITCVDPKTNTEVTGKMLRKVYTEGESDDFFIRTDEGAIRKLPMSVFDKKRRLASVNDSNTVSRITTRIYLIVLLVLASLLCYVLYLWFPRRKPRRSITELQEVVIECPVRRRRREPIRY